MRVLGEEDRMLAIAALNNDDDDNGELKDGSPAAGELAGDGV